MNTINDHKIKKYEFKINKSSNTNKKLIYFKKLLKYQYGGVNLSYISSGELNTLIDNTKCVIILQQEAGLLDDSSEIRNISTFGVGPCHAIIIYNTMTKRTFLSHVDSMCDLSILNNIYKFLEIDDPDSVEIFITGGVGNLDLTRKILDKLKMLNLMYRINLEMKIHSKKLSTFVNINIDTGIISPTTCSDYKTIPIKKINFTPKCQINRIFGFKSFEYLYKPWYETFIPIDKKLNKAQEITIRKINLDTLDTVMHTLDVFIDLPMETQHNRFENYIFSDNPDENYKQRILYNTATTFLHKLSTKHQYSDPLFFVVSGSPGIGKTHISFSVAIEAVKNGKLCLFFNPVHISSLYQSSKKNPVILDKIFNIIKRYDLIIYDDFMKEIMDYVLFEKIFNFISDNMKSMMVTTNLEYTDSIGRYINKNHPLHTICIFDISLHSKRIPWTDQITTGIDYENIDDIITKFIQYDNNQSSGIIIKHGNIDDIIKNVLSRYSIDIARSIKIKNPLEPYIDGRISSDFYMSDLNTYNLLCMKINDREHADQFIKNINIIHENKIKVIILSDNLHNTYKFIKDAIRFEALYVSERTLRIIERTKILFGSFIELT
jgi:hypothetical protein